MEWESFEHLMNETVSSLRAAEGDTERIASAITRYVEEGRSLGMSVMVLWDYFAISSPGVPEKAGYDANDEDQMVALFDQILGRVLAEEDDSVC